MSDQQRRNQVLWKHRFRHLLVSILSIAKVFYHDLQYSHNKIIMKEAAFSYSLLPTLHNFNYRLFEKPEVSESILLIRE